MRFSYCSEWPKRQGTPTRPDNGRSAVLERQFEDGSPIFIDYDHPAAGRRPLESLVGRYFPAQSEGFLFGFLDPGKFNTFLVENSHLAAFDMKEISGHLETPQSPIKHEYSTTQT